MQAQTCRGTSRLSVAFRTTVALILAGILWGCDRIPNSVPAGGPASTSSSTRSSLPGDERAIEPLPLDGSSLYYYSEGVRFQLTPSLSWIAVKFAHDDPAEQSASLQGSIAGPLNEARKLANPALTLLPVQKGVTAEQLIEGINSLRARQSSFLLVNPVFQSGDAQMILSDEFIAGFSAEKGKSAIDAINSSHGVEVVGPILGQENTFVLRVVSGARLDALAMANLYREQGLALSASPNFLRMTTVP